MSSSILLVDPTTPSNMPLRSARQFDDGLAGKVIGFIDNAKPNFNYLAADIAEILQKEHGVSATHIHRKMAASIPAQDQAIMDLATRCDLVITGSGD